LSSIGGGEAGETVPAVEMRGIVKVYPDGTLALRGVDLVVYPGERHCLLGENGAGKTTLMRILYGEIRPTRGVIRVYGREARFRGPWDALRSGIAMVYQRLSLIPVFTVADNIALALSSLGLGRREAVERARRVIAELGLEVPLDARAEELPVGLQQRAEIVKALAAGARILILDEPTSVLSPLEAEALFKLLDRLSGQGLTVIYITHRLPEVRRVCSRVTVLRKGRVVATGRVEDYTDEQLAKLMVGERASLLEAAKTRPREAKPRGPPVLEVEDLHVEDDRGVEAVKGVTLRLRPGEVLGIAGVQGNGQRELLEAVAGLRRPSRGRIIIAGRDATTLSVEERYRLGLAYIPESRRLGLVQDMNATWNSILTLHWHYTRHGMIDLASARQWAQTLIEKYGIVAPHGPETLVSNMSGGNQQKLMTAREAEKKPKILLVAEPTHGLDVAAAAQVRNVIRSLAEQGTAILLYSSDLDELLELSTRLAVIYKGKIVAEKPPSQYTLQELGLLMTKGRAE